MSTNPLHVLVFCEFLLLSLTSTSTASTATNKKSTRISRMPLFYGKRSETFSAQGSLPNPNWAERSGSFNIGSLAGGDLRGTSTREEDMIIKFLDYGKHINSVSNLDNHEDSKNQEYPLYPPGQGENVKRNLKMLSRMPAYFGKRPSMATDMFDEYKLLKEYINWKQMFALPRMPNFYASRVQTYPGWNYLTSPDFSAMKRNSFSRGKSRQNIDSKPITREVLNILKSYLKKQNENQIPRLQKIAYRLSSGDGTQHRTISSTISNFPELSDIQPEEAASKDETSVAQDSASNYDFYSTNSGGDARHNDHAFTTNNGGDKIHSNKYDDIDDNAFSDDTELSENHEEKVKFDKRRMSKLDRMPKFFGKRQSRSPVFRDLSENQIGEIMNSLLPQDYKFINLPIEGSIKQDNLQIPLNKNGWQSIERYQNVDI